MRSDKLLKLKKISRKIGNGLWLSLVEKGRKARNLKSGGQWKLGDLANKVEIHYGQKNLQKYAKEIGIPYNSLLGYRWVSKKFPPKSLIRSKFWTKLDWTIFWVIAGTKNPEKWIKVAWNNGDPLTVKGLKYKIRKETTPKKTQQEWEESFNQVKYSYSIWNALPERPIGFGSGAFKGNCSPRVIYGVLKKYSDPNDRVLDPMAGSGTFIDLAKMLGYPKERILAFDINPTRPDIKFGDAADTGLEPESMDFIFAHFPYWNTIKYSDHPQDLSNLSYSGFIKKSRQVFEEMYRVLKPKKFFVVMIGDLRQKGIIDLSAELSRIGREKFTLWDKIITQTYIPQAFKGGKRKLWISRARKQKTTLINHDTLLVFRK